MSEVLDRAAALLREKQAAEAEQLLARILGDMPESAQAWFMTGVARHLQLRPEAALAAMERALQLDPGLDEARRAVATLLAGLKRPQAAMEQIEALHRRRPASADFHVDAGIMQETLGNAAAALAHYDAALRLAPHDFPARQNRGLLLARLGRFDAALRDHQELVRRYIGSAVAHYNLGDLLLRLDRHAEALAAAERALALSPRAANVLMLRGLALAMLGRDEDARASFAAAEAVDAAGALRYRQMAARAAGTDDATRLTLDPRQIRLARLLERQKVCDWSERPHLVEGLRALAAELRAQAFPLEERGLYHTALSLPLTAAEQQALADGIAQNALARAGPPLELPPRPPATREKIRLGFISADFREHPAAQLHWRQLAGHDRRRFEVFGYSAHPGDGPARERMVAACDHFRELSALGDREIAMRIALDGIDILVDLTGHLDHARPGVLALHPAPLRVSYLGFPATLGNRLVDYRVTDTGTTPPEESACWSERLVRLPHTLFIYDDRQAIAAQAPSRGDCGLPDDAFVFCCFNASYKIEPDAFSVWMRLLAGVPGSVLWLMDGGEAVRHNLRREAATRGIDPQRLVFAPRLPRPEHLARHACADLFLDSFYCGAHTTATDALWAGLPVLSCAGGTMAARIGASIVRAAGLPELVAADFADYEATALRLATHRGELAALRARLAANRLRCPLFDTARRVRELDAAFETMWQRHLAGLPPASFAVPEQPA